ncbi:MbnP family copper-binding protein [Stagnihabitans tardus]|uniref:Metallo-mystery pair system four-Cys motif protein n=1 Tax=Stagnihabitans tardus TaxID=2699202 RepID=A0AAE4YDU8_9RHOB|nr:MbnP family copper-binding protein [Stagnihabitans tardus]NBZ89498.1 metallo-mystery pair system four-Cys motif protein [Stagnihabitans tardus]
MKSLAVLTALVATPAAAEMAMKAAPMAEPVPFTLNFQATDGASPVTCTSVIEGLGPEGRYKVGINDLRFYISDVVFQKADGTSLPAKLDANDFQLTLPEGTVALIDLTGDTEGSCAPGSIQFGEGTAAVNAQVTGMNPLPDATSVSFRIGVPQEVMSAVIAAHSDKDAPKPLDQMYWNWAMGYRHFVLNAKVDVTDGTFGEAYLHIGSMGCGPMEGKALADRPRCDFVNTPLVRLPMAADGSLDVALDLREVLSGYDYVAPVMDMATMTKIGEGPGLACHSGPMQAHCDVLFKTFGISRVTGDAEGLAMPFHALP